MKIRNGFVSNSSSSSFVIVCPKKTYEKYVAKVHPFYKKWSKDLRPTTKTFLGEEVITISAFANSEDCDFEWKGKLPDDIENYGDDRVFDNREIWSNFTTDLEKFAKDVIIIEGSC